jgi:2-polyprenyl-6-methoxyphenol hydroxylase-like FAD-dependent oxidoreductase
MCPATPSSQPVDVLIAGAGPTGLVLALWLKRLAVNVRIVDAAAEAGTTSRALAVHARTLELYQQVGIADEAVEQGLRFAAINMWVRGKHAARADLSDIGEGLSPYPYALVFPQDQHEKLLLKHLELAGTTVERCTRLVGFEDRGDGVVARLEHQDGTAEECEASYVAGCDGAHSKVREGLELGFPGGTYRRMFYVADVDLRGPTANHELHVALDEADLLAVFPMRGQNVARLIGTVARESAGDDANALTWNDVSRSVVERMQITIDRVNWFSTYRVHHRVAEHFGRGRAFILGDAAHIHSPVGGQGMNTGIGDAVNLAWKLASVLRGRADTTLLDTYEPERIAFAKRLVATTDRAFTFATKNGPIARAVRLNAIPRLVPALTGRKLVRRYIFKTISQTLINYRHSSWSEGQAGSVRGGDRLPWVRAEQAGHADNFAPLTSLDWQVHVYGGVPADLATTCARLGLKLHSLPWQASAGQAGLAENAAYLVRPDGYVALADSGARSMNLEAYLDTHRLRFA